MVKRISYLRPFMIEGVREAGCDEAGRGPLAGPVFAAAVILPDGFSNSLLNDSKQLTRLQREELRPLIEREALAWAVASVEAWEIDRINILKASIKAMHLALDRLGVRPQHIIVDGNRFYNYGEIPHHCIVKGDATYMSIAAASVLAKTYRDDYMCRIAAEYPQYGWERNAGYPTQEHREAIAKYGVTPHHRKSFRLLREPELF